MKHDYTDEEIKEAENEAFRRMPIAKGHEWVKAFLDALPERPQSQPILDDDGRSLGQVQGDVWISADNAGHNANECNEISAQAVAAVVLAQAVRRMEAVPKDELWYVYEAANTGYGGMGAVRARLIAAARGEGQDKLPSALFIQELDAFRSFFGRVSLWLHHIDGKGDNQSTDDFLRRLNAIYGFAATADEANAISEMGQSQDLPASQIMRQALRHYQLAVQGRSMPPPVKVAKGEGQVQPIVVNEPPQDEKQPDLSGESEKQDEPATFESRGKAWTRHTPGDPMPCDGDAEIVYIMRDHGTCSDLARTLRWAAAKEHESRDADIIGWRYADEPAQPTTSPGWTPAVGDTVRLKSGGPVMTVTDVDPLSLMCAWMNADNELQVEPITTLCLTPVPNP